MIQSDSETFRDLELNSDEISERIGLEKIRKNPKNSEDLERLRLKIASERLEPIRN